MDTFFIDQGLPYSLSGGEPTSNAGDMGSTLGQEDPLEQEMATHSSILPGESREQRRLGGLQSMGSQSQTGLSD